MSGVTCINPADGSEGFLTPGLPPDSVRITPQTSAGESPLDRAHQVARSLIEEPDGPTVAPSATLAPFPNNNHSSAPTPTKTAIAIASHVIVQPSQRKLWQPQLKPKEPNSRTIS